MTQITAADRAAQINAATEALAGAGNISFYGLLSTDAAYWADCGVHTGAELDRLLAYEDYVETYKDRCGFKPRGLDWRSRSASEWQAAAVDF